MTRASGMLLVAAAIALVATAPAAPAGAAPSSADAVRSMIEAGKYGEAETGARELLARVEKDAGRDAPDTAEALDLLVEALYRGRGPAGDETRRLAERAVALKTKLFGPSDPRLAVSLNNLGNLLYGLGDYAGAGDLYDRVVRIRREALGPRHAEVAKAMSNLAMVLRHEGAYARAGDLYEQALGILEESFGPDHLNVARGLNSLAVLFDETGRYDRARPLYERSLGIREKALGPDDRLVAMSRTNLAVLLKNTGDYAGARRLYERALEILKASIGPEHPDLAVAMNNLAELLTLTGAYDEAAPLYEEAIRIRTGALGPDHPAVATSLHDLATLREAQGETAAARQLYERALAISEASLGPDHAAVARTGDRLGRLLAATGDLTAATRHLERALSIREKALGPDNPDVAQSLIHLAAVLSDSGKPEAAAPLVDRALAIREKVLGPDHPLVSEALVDRARLLARSRDVDGAIAAALRAERIAADHSRLTIRTLAERQALRYASIRPSGLDLAVDLAASGAAKTRVADVWDAAIRSRALVLDEVAARHRAAVAASDAAAAALLARLQEARSRLANLTLRGPGEMRADAYRSLMSEARRDKERIERDLAERSDRFRQEMEGSRAGLAEIRRRLAPGTAMVGYVVHRGLDGGRSYAAFVLPDRDADPRLVTIGEAGAIEALISRWRREALSAASAAEASLAGLEAAHRETGAALRKRIWDPVAAAIGGAGRVLVVPDGTLHLVNLWALPRAEGGYLIESTRAIHYLSAERDIVSPAGGRAAGRGLIAVGAPAFDDGPQPETIRRASLRAGDAGSAACPDLASIRFDPLPGTDREAREVVDLWGRTRHAESMVLAGSDATERAFKRHAPGRSVLHLATHGFFLGDGCRVPAGMRGIGAMGPAEPGASVEAAGKVAVDAAADSPLLRAGLALAGANRRQTALETDDDGILTAEEIAGMDLSAAEMVVLSACDTGLGDVRTGEGVLGLRRAFRIAGARTIVMSLWPVRDEATREWMGAFYRNRYVSGQPAAEAALGTSIETIRRLRADGRSTHPFQWAGFIAVGEQENR